MAHPLQVSHELHGPEELRFGGRLCEDTGLEQALEGCRGRGRSAWTGDHSAPGPSDCTLWTPQVFTGFHPNPSVVYGTQCRCRAHYHHSRAHHKEGLA